MFFLFQNLILCYLIHYKLFFRDHKVDWVVAVVVLVGFVLVTRIYIYKFLHLVMVYLAERDLGIITVIRGITIAATYKDLIKVEAYIFIIKV